MAGGDRRGGDAAARAAAVHDDIAAMPMGYGTLIGDMGTALGIRGTSMLARIWSALQARRKAMLEAEALVYLGSARAASRWGAPSPPVLVTALAAILTMIPLSRSVFWGRWRW